MIVLGPDIAREYGENPVPGIISVEDIAQDRLFQGRCVTFVQRTVIGRGPTIEPLPQTLHELAHAHVADAQLTDRAVEIGGHEIDQRLGQPLLARPRGPQAPEQQDDMEHDHLVPPLDRVGYIQFGIEDRRPGHRDDLGIKLGGDAPG